MRVWQWVPRRVPPVLAVECGAPLPLIVAPPHTQIPYLSDRMVADGLSLDAKSDRET